jgi:plastocyanin
MARPRRALPVALLSFMALAFLDAGCGGSDGGGSEDASTGTVTLEGSPANDHGTKQVSGTAQVEMGDSYFEPTILVGVPGSELTIELTNNGVLEHNINADIPQVAAAVPLDQDVRSGGGKETVKIKFPDSGQLLFFCKYHEGDGMVGALRVE